MPLDAQSLPTDARRLHNATSASRRPKNSRFRCSVASALLGLGSTPSQPPSVFPIPVALRCCPPPDRFRRMHSSPTAVSMSVERSAS